MNRKHLGWTLVELVVVVAVLGILAGIAIVGFGGWRERTARNEVKSDLLSGATALKNHRNFTSSYPATQTEFEVLYRHTEAVNLSYTRRVDGSYCLNAQSLSRPSVQWMIDSSVSVQPAEGVCS